MGYNSTVYQSRPVKFNDYISNKYDIVHKMLFEDALSKYLDNVVEKTICGNFTYELFTMFNNYFTIYNDQMTLDPTNENNIINIEIFNEYNINKIFTIDEIVGDNKIDIIKNQEYLNSLISYVQDNKIITSSLDSLDLSKEYKDNYITYVLVNVIYLLFRLKQNIADDFSPIASISNISDFIIRYNNSIYMLDESMQEVICVEHDDNEHANEVFIYEDMIKNDFHIGYNTNGKWILDIDPNVRLTGKDIRNRLLALITKANYNLWNMLKYSIKETYLRYHKIIEKKAPEYWQASSILVINKIFPYTKKQVDLKPWWNTYQEYKQHTIENIITAEKEKLADGVVEEINYVNGKAKVYSKKNDEEYIVDLNCVKDNTEINDELLAGTFMYKLKELKLQNILYNS